MTELERVCDGPGKGIVESQRGEAAEATEELLEREYQSRIEALLERASKLTSAACSETLAGGGTEPDRRQGPGGDSADLEAVSGEVPKPRRGPENDSDQMPASRPRPAETAGQLRTLREVANSSARDAVTVYGQRQRTRARATLCSAFSLAIASAAMFQLPFDVGWAKHLVALSLGAVALLLSGEYFRTIRRLKTAKDARENDREDGDGPGLSDVPTTTCAAD